MILQELSSSGRFRGIGAGACGLLGDSIWMRANDASAGSPTETLLRLLLPLSDKVH